MNNIKSKNNILSQPVNLEYLQHWIELSQSALENNAAQFQTWLGSLTKIAGVIKSNAYGHGIAEIAHLYEQSAYIASLCTINLNEAIQARKYAPTKPIIIIGYIDAAYELLIKHNLEVILYDLATAAILNETGKQHQIKIKVHIKIDTGMSRLGILPSELKSFLKQIKLLPWLHVVGLFSHLAQGYDDLRTAEQESNFALCLQHKIPSHLANSHGSLLANQAHYQSARIGIGLYGYLQRHDTEKQKLLKPVLSIKARILQIKTVTTGTKIGYDGLFEAQHTMTIATIAFGYYEGLDPRLAQGGYVLIHGKKATIIGRICMNLTIVDISEIPGCTQGDIITILGNDQQETIWANDWSTITQASVYFHLAKLSTTIPKIIVS